MIDDDVLLPPNMDFKGPLEAFQSDHSIKACAYAIRCGNLPKEYRGRIFQEISEFKFSQRKIPNILG